MCFFFFFFKQKTAYEMRISDWSSDVVLFRSGVAQGPGRFRVRRGQCRRTDDPRSADAGAARLGLCDGGNWRKEGTEWPFPLDSRSAGRDHQLSSRSEERRDGKEGVRTCRSGWSPYL